MDREQVFVGSVAVRPVFFEILRKCSATLAALSSGIVLFAMQGDAVPSVSGFIMLSLHLFSIPCLVALNVFSGAFSHYKTLSKRADALLDRLYTIGFSVSISGYLMLVWMFSHEIFLVFFCGILFAAYQIREIEKEVDSPHMKRRE